MDGIWRFAKSSGSAERWVGGVEIVLLEGTGVALLVRSSSLA